MWKYSTCLSVWLWPILLRNVYRIFIRETNLKKQYKHFNAEKFILISRNREYVSSRLCTSCIQVITNRQYVSIADCARHVSKWSPIDSTWEADCARHVSKWSPIDSTWEADCARHVSKWSPIDSTWVADCARHVSKWSPSTPKRLSHRGTRLVNQLEEIGIMCL